LLLRLRFLALGFFLLVPDVAGAVSLEVVFTPSFLVPDELSVQSLEGDLDLAVAGTPQTLVLGKVTFDPGTDTVAADTWLLGITDVILGGAPVAALGIAPVTTHSVDYVRDSSGNSLGLDPAGSPIFVELAFLGPGGGLLFEGLPTAPVSGPITTPPDGAPLDAPVQFQVTVVPEPSTAALALGSGAPLLAAGWLRRLRSRRRRADRSHGRR
jgi:hypothetical protein